MSITLDIIVFKNFKQGVGIIEVNHNFKIESLLCDQWDLNLWRIYQYYDNFYLNHLPIQNVFVVIWVSQWQKRFKRSNKSSRRRFSDSCVKVAKKRQQCMQQNFLAAVGLAQVKKQQKMFKAAATRLFRHGSYLYKHSSLKVDSRKIFIYLDVLKLVSVILYLTFMLLFELLMSPSFQLTANYSLWASNKQYTCTMNQLHSHWKTMV